MGILDIFRRVDINAEVEACRGTPGAVLLDVRSREEYAGGHIPGSLNLPLDEISQAARLLPDRAAPVYVYCLRGTRSARAVRALATMGYSRARSIGGIAAYRGSVERR